MDRNVLETQWPQVRELLSEKFSNLTEEDIRQINGRYDQLVAKLQQKYGYTREEAEERIRSWNFDRFATTLKNSSIREDKTYRENKIESSDNVSPFLKWLFLLGLPLLLLGTYFLSPAHRDTMGSTPAATTGEQMMVESTADRVFSDNVRSALMSQSAIAADAQNIQITSHNGIVTLSGFVPSSASRDAIVRSAENFAGVRQVINNLQVR